MQGVIYRISMQKANQVIFGIPDQWNRVDGEKYVAKNKSYIVKSYCIEYAGNIKIT
jgi:hypothetical protein